MDTINVSKYRPALSDLAERHHLSLDQVVERILTHGIEREYEVFDWSPSPAAAGEPASVALFAETWRTLGPIEENEAPELKSA